jgi:hypothetical protein
MADLFLQLSLVHLRLTGCFVVLQSLLQTAWRVLAELLLDVTPGPLKELRLSAHCAQFRLPICSFGTPRCVYCCAAANLLASARNVRAELFANRLYGCAAAEPPASPSDVRAELLLDVGHETLEAAAFTTLCAVQGFISFLCNTLCVLLCRCRAACEPIRRAC